MIGADFSARIHRWRCIIDGTATSVFSNNHSYYLCLLNSARSRQILQAYNPTIHFEIGDVIRLPLFPLGAHEAILARLDDAFTEHESRREHSVEFRRPGPSPWRHAQEWAQAAVDRSEDEPLLPYEAQHAPEPATDHLSFALGVAVSGHFGLTAKGSSIRLKMTSRAACQTGFSSWMARSIRLTGTIVWGIRPVSRSMRHGSERGEAIAPDSDLRRIFRTKFFDEVHRTMYGNPAIHWPLSSKKTFVAWLTIHRWNASTMRDLLADQLNPALTRLEGGTERPP